LKRLKHKLLSMDPNTATYTEMYDGKMVVVPTTNQEPWDEYDNKYYRGQIGYKIDYTHKRAQDKPTVTICIPTQLLGLDLFFENANKDITVAAADFCLRAFAPYINALNSELYNRNRTDEENGKYYLHTPGGEVLVRNTAFFAICSQKDYQNGSGSVVYLLDDGVSRPPVKCLCIRMQLQLPKKRIRKAIQMLCSDLPDAVDMFISEFDKQKLRMSLELAEKQSQIRQWLKSSKYCAFIANGSILPRSKGTDLPMQEAIPFKSTPEDEIEICGIRGMGIKRGVTVITGGGYSGKSTLLDAVAAGIYDHILGDGRELCITDEMSMTICAEDGRSVKSVNISPFIKWLPNGDTADFSTDHASGSTSQAANIMEAVNYGVKLLLIDEDRSATNFMIRDRIMKQLIVKEPITPFTDRVNELYHKKGVSTILVIGGSGEYISVADKIYIMDNFLISDVTEKSKAICDSYGITKEYPAPIKWEQNRMLLGDGFSSYPENSNSERLVVSDMGFILIGDECIDVRALYNIVSKRQIDALGFMLRLLEVSNNDSIIEIENRVDEMYEKIADEGLDCVYSSYFTTCERFLDLPRKIELLAVINRMRKININSARDN